MNRRTGLFSWKVPALSLQLALVFLCGLNFRIPAAAAVTTILTHTAASYRTLSPEALQSWIDSISLSEEIPVSKILISEPLEKTVLPIDIASVAFIWEDPSGSKAWLMTIKNEDRLIARAVLDKPWWIPDEVFWNALKLKTVEKDLDVTLTGIGGWSGREILSSGTTSFRFSGDAVNAWIMFMRKPLPFLQAKNHPQQTQLLAGDLTSFQQPENILSEIPICANCHSYSLNRKFMTVDMDFAGDKGGFTVMDLQEKMVIRKENVFSWNTLEPVKPADYSMGLFSRLSPTGRYIAGTVNETSVFVMMDDIRFSQLFFPATGHIAIFDIFTNKFYPLPGASEAGRVQTSPGWSPDGRTIAFASVPADAELIQQVLDKKILKESSKQHIDELNRKYPVQFDIYTVPFNDGAGGEAVPLEGASQNGFSNYFPRYSPDGKWLVFTQSPTGLVLQPNSRLLIVPAAGGIARPLESNRTVMNSWHSWSPNSKWMVFTCKENSPYTELYLTHIDEQGIASPAVRLFRFSHNEMAAMVPEFLSRSAVLPKSMAFNSPEEAKGESMAVDGR